MTSVLNYYNPNIDVRLTEFQHYLKQLHHQCIVVGDMNAHTPILHLGDHSNITDRNLELLLSREDACLLNPVNLFTYTDRRTSNQSCLDICLGSCNLVDLGSLTLMRDVGSDHYSLIISVDVTPKSHIIGRPPRWTVKDADWGLWASKIPDSTLESSNSITELNDDLGKRFRKL